MITSNWVPFLTEVTRYAPRGVLRSRPVGPNGGRAAVGGGISVKTWLMTSSDGGAGAPGWGWVLVLVWKKGSRRYLKPKRSRIALGGLGRDA
jgi:hypothetical protein